MSPDPEFDSLALRARTRVPWYRRRTVLIGAAVVVLVGGSVAFDVGGSATKGTRGGDLRGYVATLNSDIASCNSSLRDSVSAYAAVVGGQTSERSTAEGIIAGDEPNCTPESNSNIYDFATTEAPASLRAYPVQAAANDVDRWAFPVAAAAISDLGTLLAHPGDARTRRDLSNQVAQLVELAGSAQRAFDGTAHALGTRVNGLDLGATSLLQRSGF